MAQVNNPRKQFQFGVFIPGFNEFLAQEVKLPDIEFDIATHGDIGFEVKTAALKKIGMLVVNKISPNDQPDDDFNDWQLEIFDTLSGGGALPQDYKRDIIIEEYSNDGITVVQRHQYIGCWPQKINGHDLNRKGSDNTVTSIEFCIDEVDQ